MKALEIVGLGFLGVALIVGLFFLGIGIKVYSAPWIGKANETVIIQSAENRIAQQERFEQIFNDLGAADRQIVVTAQTLSGATTDSDRSFYTQVLNGQRNHCQQIIADYNANAEKVSAEDFRDTNLPVHIDPNQHCK